MSRLTDTEYGVYCAHANTIDCDDCNSCKWSQAIFDKLAHYEDLEEQGRLIELPCKMDDKLYDITDFVEHCPRPEMYEVHASWISFSTDKSGELWIDIGGFDYRLDDFGKTVFLTKAEAEAKLAEMGGGCDE